MKINELVTKAHEEARARGWWDIVKSPLEIYALLHSEISEAVEEARIKRPEVYQIQTSPNDGADIIVTPKNTRGGYVWNKEFKPEGEAIELADCIIRIADYFGYQQWDLEKVIKLKLKYNETRSYRHGNKKY